MRAAAALLCTSACAAGMWLAASAGAPVFYPDDPIWRDPEVMDAAGVQAQELSEQYDLLENSFLDAGDRADRRAMNVNTVDQVPDSSWFTNRAGGTGAAAADAGTLARGPGTGKGPVPGTWTVTGRKSEGVTPGFTIRDAEGETYWIKFDPAGFPEMASGAEVIATRFFHAFGYHVPENDLALLDPEALVIAPDATMRDEDGRRRPLTRADVQDVLDMAAARPDGRYRVLASRNLPGRPLGPFRYHGTRPDDPNDIFPHEHRRELRGLAVFAAWLNHDELRSTNSLDTLVAVDGRQIVRHHLLDFGSTLGSGSVRAQSRRAGNEFVWETRPTFVTMLTLGLYVRPWIKVPYPEIPSVGRFESTYYRAEAWKPDYPNPAFRNARPDDRFWAASIVAALPDEAVTHIVGAAAYSDPRAAAYIAQTLRERRTKVLDAWLNGTNPLVDLALSPSGELTFRNAAERAGVAKAATHYTVQWSRLDNATGVRHEAAPATRLSEPRAALPAALAGTGAEYVAATLRAFHADQPAWAAPLVACFRRLDTGWQLVGLERGP